MNKITTLLCLGLAISSFLHAQESLKKNYDFGIEASEQAFEEVVLLTDGNLLFAGRNTLNTSNQNWVLTKRDTTGEEIWTTFYGENRFQFLNEMLATPDGGAILMGVGQAFNADPNRKNMLLRINSEGEEVWLLELDDPLALDGDLMDSGDLAILTLSNGNLKIHLVDQDGAVSQELVGLTGVSASWNGLIATDDGGFLIFSGATLAKYGADLQVQWMQNYEYNNENITIYDLSDDYMHASNNGVYVFNGGYSGGSVAMLIDATGAIEVQRDYPPLFAGTSEIIGMIDNELVIANIRDFYSLALEDLSFQNDFFADELNLPNDFALPNDALILNEQLYIAGSLSNVDAGTNPFISKLTLNDDFEWIFNTIIGEMLPDADQTAYSVARTPDGGYVFVGPANFSGKREDFTMVKTDASGNVLWERIVGDGDTEVLYSVINTMDGGLLTSGLDLNDETGTSPQLVVTKLEANGTSLWERRFNCDAINNGIPVLGIELSDGNFAIVYPVNFTSRQVIKLSATGDSIWNKTYEDTSFESLYEVTQLRADDQGGFSVLQQTIFDRGQIVKTDENGNVLLDFTINPAFDSISFSYGLEHTSDGGYMVAGTYYLSQDYYVAKIDPTGAVEWLNRYEVDGLPVVRPSLTKTNDGHYIALINRVGGNESAESSASILLHKVDEQGNTIWTQGLGEDKWFRESVFDYQSLPNNGVAIVGHSRPTNHMDMLLIVTNSDGTVALKNIRPFGQLDLYPNPSEGPLNWQFQSEQMGTLKLSLFNHQGQLIRQFVEQKSTSLFEQSYQLSELPAGHYLFRLELNQRSITKSWIKY
ncbi:MAG: T9SS type A sorting domain-containing protein [Bacteroidota bacterium]